MGKSSDVFSWWDLVAFPLYFISMFMKEIHGGGDFGWFYFVFVALL